MARPREPQPVATGSAADFIPPRSTLPKLREAARRCRGCHLWVNATQTVFGEGASSAEVMLVGEQPGDQEDGGPLQIRPHRTRTAIAQETERRRGAGLQSLAAGRNSAHQASGHRCTRGNSAQALLGKDFRVTQRRGTPVASEHAEAVIATVHPSSVLRARPADREQAKQEFFRDLISVARYLDGKKAKVAGSL